MTWVVTVCLNWSVCGKQVAKAWSALEAGGVVVVEVGGLGGRLVSEFMARLVCARDAGCAGCPDASALVLSA